MKGALLFVFVFFSCVSPLEAFTIETPYSYFVWNNSSPSFRMYSKNAYGFVVTNNFVDVVFSSFATRGVLCVLPLGSTSLGTGWTATTLPRSFNQTTERLVFSKSLGGGQVSFTFEAMLANFTYPAYGGQVSYPLRAGVLKTTLDITGWNFGLADCMLLNFDVKPNGAITGTIPLLTPILSSLILNTQNYNVQINSLLKVKVDGLISVLDALTSLLGNLLGALLGQFTAPLYYKFPTFNTLQYDPDFSVLLNKPPDCTGLGNCNSHGTCVYDNQCRCNSGWSGASCNTIICSTCNSAHGTCVDSSSGPICQCQQGWTGNDCSIPDCPGDPDCNYRGICNTSLPIPFCSCLKGWTGFACEFADCPGTPDCSDQGSCNAYVSPPICQCNPGWGSENCSVAFDCAGDTDCNHGNCVNGSCSCDAGWVGTTCNVATCAGYDPSQGGSNCNNRGSCVVDDNGASCDCDLGWTGTTCENAVCALNCSGRGTCLQSSLSPFCNCDSGYAGADCSELINVTPIPGDAAPDVKSEFTDTSNFWSVHWPTFVYSIGAAIVLVTIGIIAVEIRRRRIRAAEINTLKRMSMQALALSVSPNHTSEIYSGTESGRLSKSSSGRSLSNMFA